MPMHRRTFFLGSLTAAASARVMGANSRLGIALVGPGAMGVGHLRTLRPRGPGAERRDGRRLRPVEQAARGGGRQRQAGQRPRAPQLQHLADVLAMKEVDGVLLATPDHQHARQLIQSVQAGKDVYCEKPMGNVLAEVKEAYRVVKAGKQVVQLGTHRLSNGSCQAAAAFVRSGKLGKISRVDHQGSVNSPRWSPVPAVKEIRERDTDWKAWLMGHRPRPFDARLYFEYRLFREFSNGIPDQWLTHAATAVHHIMDDYFPISVVASGGVLVYPDGRESSDTFGATLLYPKGFLFTYAAMFGNNYPGHVRYFGQNGTIERVGGDDDGTYVVKGLGGGDRPEKIKQDIPLPPIAPTNHIKNWLECMRSRTDAHRRCSQRLRPLGGVDHGGPLGMDGQEAVLGRPARGDRRQAGGLIGHQQPGGTVRATSGDDHQLGPIRRGFPGIEAVGRVAGRGLHLNRQTDRGGSGQLLGLNVGGDVPLVILGRGADDDAGPQLAADHRPAVPDDARLRPHVAGHRERRIGQHAGGGPAAVQPQARLPD